MHAHSVRLFVLIVTMAIVAMVGQTSQAGLHPSYSSKVTIDTVPFYPNANYDPTIPDPNEFLADPLGVWPLRYNELVTFIKELAARSDRVVLEEHTKTHEGRQLYNLFISTPENIANLTAYRATMDKIADPEAVGSKAELDALVASVPAFAWLGYSIHGDEISGVDAAARLAYHLAAGRDSATMHLLENVVIIIDPIENPDGRERYLSMLQSYRSHVPNYDRRSQQHSGVWPWGRGNHYLFDLNRDWILLSQPETRGRTGTILKWHPVMVVDAHEMGSNATYLFSPPREPINYNTPANVHKWWKVFMEDQAEAFDQRRWPYYVGEWHEQWYSGYGSAWPTFFGTIGILYEQAGVDGQFVKQRDDYILTYHEAVNHQFTSSLANLFSTANNAKALLRDYHNARKTIVEQGRASKETYFIVPDGDDLKTKRFIESLLWQDIKIRRSSAAFTVSSAEGIDQKQINNKKFPKGTYIIKLAQPQGALAKTILDFDPRLKYEFLKEERRELEKHGDTRMYEVSAWSTPLAYDMDAYRANVSFSVGTEEVAEYVPKTGSLINAEARYAFIINMEGEKTFRILGRLFDEDLKIFASEKDFESEGHKFEAGSLILRKRGNPDNLTELLGDLAVEIGIDVIGVNSGASSKGSFLGAGTFHLLRRPHIGLLTGAPLSFTTFASLWFAIDKELELPHSLLQVGSIGGGMNISEYNVIVIPSTWGNSLGSTIGKGGKKKLTDWVSNGGTLICMGKSAVWAADSATGLSKVKLKRQSLEKLKDFTKVVDRELRAEAPPVDTIALFHPEKITKKDTKEDKPDKVSKEDREDLDKWQRKFFPRGVIMQADLDWEDWLAFGMKKSVPVILNTSYAFMAQPPVKTTARFADKNSLRLSGLLWPEARERWAKTAYATHERKGRGQIILFAGEPNMRAYFWGTRKMFINAILYGPGMGTSFEGPY